MIEEKGLDDLSKLYEDTLKQVQEGEVVKGKIVGISAKDVMVDIGYKSEGLIPLAEFVNPKELKIGDEVEVFVEQKENDEGRIVLSRIKAERLQGWDNVVKTYKEGDLIDGRAMRKVRGGVMVDVGVEAFLPNSQVGMRGQSVLSQLFERPFKYKIIKIDKVRKGIVLSRRDAIALEKEEGRLALVKGFSKGELRKGVVKNITDFGAFVDLGGVDGLLHITDMSWGRISHPSEMLAVGDTIDVVILDVNLQAGKIALGLKQTTPDPWQNVEVKYPVGSRVKGKVVNILPYGAFIELERGVEGLAHISELSWTRRINNPQEVFAIGDVVEAIVLSIDKETRRLSLGIKQLEINPWLEVEKKYSIGSKVKGKVRTVTDYGAFVELEEGIDGLIHVSDLSWTKKPSPHEVFKKGQKVEAVVLVADGANKKLALGIKQLTPDTWPELVKELHVEGVLEGKIVKIMPFGLFVELEGELEGLVHISELERMPPSGKLEESYKVGDTVQVKILGINEAERKIALSMKGTK